MAKQTTTKGLQNFESIVILIFVAIFLFYMTKRCSGPAQMQPLDEIESVQDVTPTNNAPISTTRNTTLAPARIDTIIKTQVIQTPPTVYVSIDSLKMRSQPNLSGGLIMKLPKGSEVIYLNEKTSFTQKVSLNGVPYNEPWVRIQTKDNKKGWVYSGGLRFYYIK